MSNPTKAQDQPIYIPYWLHKKKNGEIFATEVTLAPVIFKGDTTILATVRDISLRVQVERELEKSEKSFNLALQEAGMGTWDYDVEKREMTVGRGFTRIIGRPIPGGKFAADYWLKQIHPDDISTTGQQFMEHIEGRTPEYRSQYRVKTADGSYRWIQTAGRAIERDSEGRAIRLVGVIMDINDTRRLTREVEETRNFLETIISSIEAILFVKDLEGRYLLANRAFSEKLGLESSKIIGKGGKELGVQFDIDSNFSDQLVMQEGVEYTYEKEVKLVDGKTYDFLITKIPIRDTSGKVYALVGLATDVTRIKQLERDLRNNVFSLDAAVNGTGNGLWDWNPKTDELILNDNWFGMLGFTRSQFNKKYASFGFKTFADQINPEDIEKVTA